MPRKRAGQDREPTELENCVLAIIGQSGPCSPYAIRKSLAESESSYWSASAGAIYPLLEKIGSAGWVEFEEHPFGERTRRRYRLSPEGRRLLRRWLSAPVPPAVAAHTYDPLRARVFFLDLVPADARRVFLDDAIAMTAEVLDRHRENRDRQRPELNEWDLRGREGAIRELAARLEWLRKVRAVA